MKTISKSAKAKIAKTAVRAIAAAYERYSVKCAMSLLGFAEQGIAKHATEMRNLTTSDEPIIKYIGETNLHACKFMTDVIEITCNTLEQQAGSDQWSKICKDFDFIDSDVQTTEEIKEYWAETAPTVVAKAGRITKEDIRQHMVAVAE